MAARLAHNQEVAGSNPAPATRSIMSLRIVTVFGREKNFTKLSSIARVAQLVRAWDS